MPSIPLCATLPLSKACTLPLKRFGVVCCFILLPTFYDSIELGSVFSIQGFLSFTLDGTKWKTRYFVLVPAEKMLYYFEDTESSKPKGIINLNTFSLLSLDESMFNKKCW